jgi:hypothetical protein
MQEQCPKCDKKHNLYYLIKRNSTRALFVLCPREKGRDKVFVLFLPLIDNLDIPFYLAGSKAYEELKASVQMDGEFTDAERKVITAWRTARLTAKYMTPEQLALIKRYVSGNVRW